MWILFALGSALFAGLTSILAKIGIKNTDSNLATALRTIIVTVFAWLMVFIVGAQNGIANIELKSIIFLVLSGLATGGSWLCYYRALQIGDVNKVVPVDKLSTVLTMILSFILLNESLTWLKIVAMVLIGVGTYMMIERKEKGAGTSADAGADVGAGVTAGAGAGADASADAGTDAGAGAGANSGKGYRWLLFASLSAVFASLTAILSKIGIVGVDSNLGTAIRTVVVLIMAWIIVVMQGKHAQVKSIDSRSWLFLGLSGLATGLSWLCYYRALQLGPVSVVVPIDKLSILVTVAFSFFVLREKLNKVPLAGLAMIVAGTLSLLIT